MASRTRYRLDRVDVEAGEVRQAKWTFVRDGRQAPVKGNEHLYAVTDENLPGRNAWEFVVRVPRESGGRVEIRPKSTPRLQAWSALTYRSHPRGNRTKDVIRGDQRRDLPKWFDGLRSRMRRKESVRATRGTDGNQLVILVSPDDHEMMIRLYFAMKVWVLKEGIELQ